MRNDALHRDGKRFFAFTLIELIVIMFLLSTVMGISVTLIFTMFDFQQRQTEQSAQLNSTNHFVERFRNDARSQYIAEIAPNDETVFRWSEGANVITYSITPGEFPEKSNVVRSVWRNEQLVGTETYHLPDYATLRFVAGEGDYAGQIAISLWLQPPYTTVINPEELDPFTRTLTRPQDVKFDPNVNGNWRTVIVRGVLQNSEPNQIAPAATESEGAL